MVCDIANLFSKQSRIKRMEHCSHPGSAIPCRKMPCAVPAHRSNPIARLNPGGTKRIRYPFGIPVDACIVGSGCIAICITRDDFLSTVPLCRMVYDTVDSQFDLLHQSIHFLAHSSPNATLESFIFTAIQSYNDCKVSL